MSPLFSCAQRAPGWFLAGLAAVMAGAVKTSPGPTPKPARPRVAAIQARVCEVVLVTSATAKPAARSRATASTAPGTGRQDTVSTPSMSSKTARIRRMN